MNMVYEIGTYLHLFMTFYCTLVDTPENRIFLCCCSHKRMVNLQIQLKNILIYFLVLHTVHISHVFIGKNTFYVT